MGTAIKNKNPNSGSIFLIILFLVFALIYADRSQIQASPSSGYSSHNELALGNGSLHLEAAIYDAVSLPDLYKFAVNAFPETNFNQYSLHFNLSGYNNILTRNFNDIQKTTLEIEPLFLRRLLYHLSLSEKEDLSFLS